MSDQMMGIDYFSLSTEIKDDDKVFELRYRYGMPEGAESFDHAAAWAAYGRFVELLASIYREGFAVEVTRQRVFRMSQQMGMDPAEFERFVQTCVDVGLFDDGLWCREHVLTSRGIQKRYFRATQRRKGKVPDELRRLLLVDVPGDSPRKHDADMVTTSGAHGADTMTTETAQRKEKERKGKKRKDDLPVSDSGKGKGARRAGDIAGTLLAPGPSRQPYPLACLSLAATDGTVYEDGAGGSWGSPWDALVSRWRSRVGPDGIGDFAAKVAAKCPAGCACGPDQVGECYALLSEALDKYDPAKAASPAPLALRVLEDRGKRRG